MLLKYKVPYNYKRIYDYKKVIYCRVLKQVKTDNDTLYLVRMINHKNRSNVFSSKELKKLNLFDYIKAKFMK